jgi:hypothetical protein
MPEILADPLSPSCSPLFSGPENQGFQRLGPDPFRVARATRANALEGELRRTRTVGTSGFASADKLNAFDPASGKESRPPA